MTFFNRTNELQSFDERLASKRGEYMVVYGRRRVGKTELINQFVNSKHNMYFEASAGSKLDHLADISSLLAEVTGSTLLKEQPLSSWAAVFAAIEEEAAKGPLIVVLDEFQYIAKEAPEIGSHINKFWRKQKDNPGLFLILSGSDVSFFEKEVIGYAASTYGRRTGGMRLQPFQPDAIRFFLPSWSVQDLIRAYGVFGGIPYYLENVNSALSLAENIWKTICSPDGLLREEPYFLLAQETTTRQDQNYFSIMRAIANGQTQANQIAQRIMKDSATTASYLNTLLEMGLIKKVHPVTANTERSKTVRYSIAEPFMRFWFRFIYPYQSRIRNKEMAEKHVFEFIMPNLDQFISIPTFEEICQGWLLDTHSELADVGNWWGSVKERGPHGTRNVSRELDAVGINADNEVKALGSCKWTEGPIEKNELHLMERLAAYIGKLDVPIDFYFFGKAGHSDALSEEAEANPRCHLVTLEELMKI